MDSDIILWMLIIASLKANRVSQGPCLGLKDDHNNEYRSGNHCWFKLSTPTDWESAQNQCRLYGSSLPIIYNEELEKEAMVAVGYLSSISSPEYGLWTGGELMQTPWMWQSGTPMYSRVGCCMIDDTTMKRKEFYPNSASICVTYCLQNKYRFAYLKVGDCVCSNTSCKSLPDDYCNDICAGNHALPVRERCGNDTRNCNYHTGYNTTDQWFPPLEDEAVYGVCAALNVTKSVGRKLITQRCETETYYICQRGDFPNDTFTVFRAKMTWTNAKTACRRSGGILATIKKLQQDVDDPFPVGIYWVGLSRVRMQWFTGEEMNFHSFGVFTDDYVNTCVYVSRLSKSWLVNRCSEKYETLCVKGLTTKTSISGMVLNASNSRQETTAGFTENTSTAVLPPLFASSSTNEMLKNSVTFMQICMIIGAGVGICLCGFAVVYILCKRKSNSRWNRVPTMEGEVEMYTFT